MANSSVSEGKSAQVIQHPRALSAPVKQGRLAGRRPKGVFSLQIYKRNVWMTKIHAEPQPAPAPTPKGKVQELEEVLFYLKRMITNTEYDLCRAKQLETQHQG